MSDTTKTIVTLGNFGADMVWFTSIGSPAGVEVRFNGVVDDETGETYDLDPWDAASALPFDFDLEGTVNEAGEWEWSGEGEPRDWNRNTVTQIKAFRDQEGS